MKTNFWGITIAAATLLLLTSCQRDELQGGSISGEEVSVSISATMPIDGGAVVKSDTEPGDGSLANRCIMQIYYLPDGESGSADPIPYGDRVTVAVSGMKALFPDQRLVSGHDYRFVFWADHVTDNSSAEDLAQDLHYDTEEFPIVSFKEEEDGTLSYSSNDDTRDAFFAADVRNISGPSSLSFDLKRPFGQLNIITTDWGDVVDQLRPSKLKLDFKSLPNSIDLVSGVVNGSEDIVSEVAVSLVPENGDSKQLSFDYIFAKDGEQTVLADFTMNFYTTTDGNTPAADPYTFSSIPVRRNYITNVRGNLLTDRTEIEVDIVPGFDGEYNEIIPETEVSDAQTLLTVLEEGGYARLTGDVAITGASAVADGKEVVLDLDGHSLTLHWTMSTSGTSSLTLMNGTVKSSESYEAARYLVSASAGGSVALENVTMTSAGAGIGVAPSGDPGKVTVRNSRITAFSYAVGTNASTPIRNAEIELYNSELVGMSAVLMNLPSVITVSECTLQGSMHAMILRAGTAKITDSHLKLVYDSSNGEGDTAEDAKDHYIDKWGSGNYVPLAAITVGNDNSKGYLYPTVLTIDNSVITADESGALPAMYVRANTGADNGVTITYGENCKVEGSIEYYDGGSNITVNGTPVTE